MKSEEWSSSPQSPNDGGHIIDSFALSSFGGVGGNRPSFSSSFTSTGNNSHFSIRFYFVKVGDCVTGDFLHIYTMSEGQKEENGKGVCTRADDRVHTVGEVSSDTLL